MQSARTRQAIVIGGLMVLFGALMLIQEFYQLSEWIWITVLIASGVAVFGIYAIAREEPWMLIVSYALLAVGVMIALVTLDILRDAVIVTYVMTVIAVPFIYGYLRTGRANWGLLIPAYVMLAVGVMVPLIESDTLTDTAIPAYVMFAIALPFLVVFALNVRQWWALIVGGILLLVSLSFIVATALVEYVTPVILILVGGGILARQLMRREAAEAPRNTGLES